MLVDDVYGHLAFHDFATTHPRWSVVAANPDGSYRFGIALKEGDLAATLHDRASAEMHRGSQPARPEPDVRLRDVEADAGRRLEVESSSS